MLKSTPAFGWDILIKPGLTTGGEYGSICTPGARISCLWSTQIIRQGITYYANNHLRFTLGYAYARNYPAAGLHTVRPENKLWQQVLWTSRQRRLQTQQWIRVEEPFNRKIANDQLQEGYNFNLRFRYLLNLMVPLNRDFIEPNALFFAFNDEIHTNTGKTLPTMCSTKTDCF